MQNLDPAAYISDSAQIYGKVDMGPGSSVWPNTVMRAEMQEIRIGRMTNIQDFVMIHVGAETGSIIGDFCSITHHVTIHGATIGDDCLIGINATIMDGAVIGSGSIVAGGAFIPEGKEYPPNSIIMGSPGKVKAERDSSQANRLNAWMYHRNAEAYARGDHRAWDGPEFDEWRDKMVPLVFADEDRALLD